MAPFRLLRIAVLVELAAFLSAPSLGEAGVLRVDEAQIKFRVGVHPVVELPVVNVSAEPLPGTFRLELLDTNDSVESVVTGTFQGLPGTNLEKVLWPMNSLARISALQFGWYRLRYAFAPRPDSETPPAQGIVQLSRVLTGIFQVRIAAASKARPGNRFPVRVRVDDPTTGKPRRGADVELALTLDDDEETTLRHALQTDFAGYAVYTFDLPKETKAETGTVKARVSRGALSDEAEIGFQMGAKAKITLTTDKPLYQPGQVAHLRALAFGPDKRALTNKDVVIAIEDEDGDEQFHETARTSRFGVASADWNIPAKLRLGDYRATATVKGSEDDYDDDSQSSRAAGLRVLLGPFILSASSILQLGVTRFMPDSSWRRLQPLGTLSLRLTPERIRLHVPRLGRIVDNPKHGSHELFIA